MDRVKRLQGYSLSFLAGMAAMDAATSAMALAAAVVLVALVAVEEVLAAREEGRRCLAFCGLS